MNLLVALFFLGFVGAQRQVDGGPFDDEAYPVKRSRRDEGTYAAPPPPLLPALDVGTVVGGPFDDEAYPVKWSPRGEDSYAAPPPPPLPALDVGTVAGEPFDDEAYPVKWSPRGEDTYAAPPPPPLPPVVDVEAPPVHKKNHIMVQTGMLFLKRTLFDGAVLPPNTELGQATGTSSPGVMISTTDPSPPQFAYANLEHILAFYSIAQSSELARKVASTLLFCRGTDAADQKEEPQVCATTQRAAMDFATSALGTTTRAARTVVHGRGEPRTYVVAPNGIARIGGGKVVPCHPLPYPADVLYCHRPRGVQALRVELVRQEDPSQGATAIAVCHEETANWDEEYFLMLNGSRGEPICHYMPERYVLWVAGPE